jgi:hypothetical protein
MFLVYADDVNLLGVNMGIVNNNREVVLDDYKILEENARKAKVGAYVHVSSPN